LVGAVEVAHTDIAGVVVRRIAGESPWHSTSFVIERREEVPCSRGFVLHVLCRCPVLLESMYLATIRGWPHHLNRPLHVHCPGLQEIMPDHFVLFFLSFALA